MLLNCVTVFSVSSSFTPWVEVSILFVAKMWKCSVTCNCIMKMSTYFKYCKLSYLRPLSKKSLLSNRCPLTMLSLYYMPLSNRCPPHDNYLIQCTSGPGPTLPHPHPWALNDLDHVAINFSYMYYGSL